MHCSVVHYCHAPLFVLVSLCLFTIMWLLLTHNCGARVMQYALCKIGAIFLCPESGPVVKPCIMENMHYKVMRYEKVYYMFI